MNDKLSIILPTYTGEEFIGDCIGSIIDQDRPGEYVKELIVVIDGPNNRIHRTVEGFIGRFKEENIELVIIQFKKNQGRLAARLKGAVLSTSGRLLLVDDRVRIPEGYLQAIYSSDEHCLIPYVKDAEIPNVIAYSLSELRKLLYKPENADDIYITRENFDDIAKGAAGMLIDRDIFIAASEHVKETSDDVKTASDDTRIFHEVVNSGVKICKSSKHFVYYHPRQKLSQELQHLYKRGPMFVDYYLRPHRKYFLPLLAFYALVVLFLLVVFIKPQIAFLIFTGCVLLVVLFSVVVTKSLTGGARMLAGLCFVLTSFGFGLLVGLMKKALRV